MTTPITNNSITQRQFTLEEYTRSNFNLTVVDAAGKAMTLFGVAVMVSSAITENRTYSWVSDGSISIGLFSILTAGLMRSELHSQRLEQYIAYCSPV